MNPYNKMWNKSYSESDLMATNAATSPVIIRRTVCMEEVVPSFVPVDTGYFNKISSPHRRKNFQQYKASLNLTISPFTKGIEYQIANLNLTNDQVNSSFSSFSFKSPQNKALNFGTEDLTENMFPLFKQKLNTSETQPMEVDSFKDSKNDIKVEEVNDNDCNKIIENKNDCVNPIIPQENGVRLRNLRVQTFQNADMCDKTKTEDKRTFSTFQKILFAFLSLLIFVGASLSISTDFISDILDLESKRFDLIKLTKDLTTLVYRQDQAVNKIIHNLETRETWIYNKKVLAFFGASGVGKTFVTNILKENFPKKSVYEIDGRKLDNFDAKTNVLANLKTGSFNLVIIDDVTEIQCESLVKLFEAVDHTKNVLFIAVFSTVHVDENLDKMIDFEHFDKVETYFKNQGIDYDMIVFNTFPEKDVEDWITNQLTSHRIPFELHQNIVKNVLKDYNIEFSGLKGLHNKIVLEISNFV